MTVNGSSKLYAAALAALVTRQVMAVAFDDTSTSCYVNRPNVAN